MEFYGPQWVLYLSMIIQSISRVTSWITWIPFQLNSQEMRGRRRGTWSFVLFNRYWNPDEVSVIYRWKFPRLCRSLKLGAAEATCRTIWAPCRSWAILSNCLKQFVIHTSCPAFEIHLRLRLRLVWARRYRHPGTACSDVSCNCFTLIILQGACGACVSLR